MVSQSSNADYESVPVDHEGLPLVEGCSGFAGAPIAVGGHLLREILIVSLGVQN